MGRLKSRGDSSQRREKVRREEVTRERVRRKKIQVREKVETSQNTVFFQWFVALEGRKVGSLKRRVRSHLGRWEMNNCTPLWREAHLEVKMLKAPHCRSTFGSSGVEKVQGSVARSTFQGKTLKTPDVRSAFGNWDAQKVHVVVARSKFPSQNAQKAHWEHFWNLRCSKGARRCSAKHISKSKCAERFSFGTLLEVQMPKKCTPLWREPHFEVKSVKAGGPGALFEFRMRFCVAGAMDSARCVCVCGFCSSWKTMAGVGRLKRICKDAFSVAGAVQKTCLWEMLGGQGAHFLRGVAFWSIRSSGLLRWFCVTGAALCMTWHHFFVVGAVL